MADETTKPADSAAAAAEDDETEERGQAPDLGTVARERSLFGEAWEANVKRSYDEYQDLSLSLARAGIRFAETIQAIQTQILANMAEVSRLGSTNAIRHADQQASAHIQQTQITATQVTK